MAHEINWSERARLFFLLNIAVATLCKRTSICQRANVWESGAHGAAIGELKQRRWIHFVAQCFLWSESCCGVSKVLHFYCAPGSRSAISLLLHLLACMVCVCERVWVRRCASSTGGGYVGFWDIGGRLQDFQLRAAAEKEVPRSHSCCTHIGESERVRCSKILFLLRKPQIKSYFSTYHRGSEPENLFRSGGSVFILFTRFSISNVNKCVYFPESQKIKLRVWCRQIFFPLWIIPAKMLVCLQMSK